MPGLQNLYLSDDIVFQGPPSWSEGTDVSPSYEVPKEVIESATGVAFLKRSGAKIAESLESRVDDAILNVLDAKLVSGLSSATSEHLILGYQASDEVNRIGLKS